ncbi:CbrC family protein [Aneurinibacillus sp. REN35]|uniref:CbrC family protein n=1 Tax=Aneurinibacillus sp. REN35 TaxID=3237286 RepID=UPI003528E2DC
MLSFVIEIDVTMLEQSKKGSFFAGVRKIFTQEEFEIFRLAAQTKKEVHTAKIKNLDGLLRMEQLACIVSSHHGRYTIYKVEGLTRSIGSIEEVREHIEHFIENNQLPVFTYHPNVYKQNIIIYHPNICEVCEKEQEYFYDLHPYSEYDLEHVCVYCIANGEANKKFGAEFNNVIAKNFDGVDQEKIKELVERTPSYITWQGEFWFSHCNNICAFIGDLQASDIENFKEEVVEDLEEQAEWFGLTVDEYIDELVDGHMQGYLFQCLHCGKHNVYSDMD